MELQREMVVDSLEQMCELMCGGIEEDYEDEHEYSGSTTTEESVEYAN